MGLRLRYVSFDHDSKDSCYYLESTDDSDLSKYPKEVIIESMQRVGIEVRGIATGSSKGRSIRLPPGTSKISRDKAIAQLETIASELT